MNPLIRLIGEISLKVRSAEELVEAERYKKRLASCGRNVRIGKNCNMIPEHIHVGNNVVIGMGSYLIASIAHIHIGNNVMMGPQVVIRGDHRCDLLGRYMIDIMDSEKLKENDKDVTICDDVWIGQGAIILKGVTIGEGSIVGAGAVVAKDIPPYTIYIGQHTPYAKPRFTAEQIKQHKELLNNR